MFRQIEDVPNLKLPKGSKVGKDVLTSCPNFFLLDQTNFLK